MTRRHQRHQMITVTVTCNLVDEKDQTEFWLKKIKNCEKSTLILSGKKGPL